MSEHPSHPWYGPCDALADGECAECRKTIQNLREQVRRVPGEIADWLEKIGLRYSHGVDVAERIRSLSVSSNQSKSE